MKSNTIITDVFFDLDHTLWDFDRNSALAFQHIFENYYPTIPRNEFVENYIPINQSCWKRYQNNQITHDQLRYERLKLSFEAIDISLSDVEINDIANLYILHLTQNNHLITGTIDVLNYLKPKYKLHIISNGFAHIQDKKMTQSGLLPYFETQTYSDLAGAKKPNNAIFELALQKAKTQNHNSIMIGDCLDADVLGAIGAGFEAVFFNQNGLEAPKNIKQIQNLQQLKNFL